MPRFKFHTKLAILAIALVITLHLPFTPSSSIQHLSHFAASYRHAAGYHAHALGEEQTELSHVYGEQGVTYPPEDSAAIEQGSNGEHATQGSVAQQTQSISGEEQNGRPVPQKNDKSKNEFEDIPEETPEERRCFKSELRSPNPIPKVVNVIWVNETELSFMSYLAMRAALVSLQPERLNLHYTDLNEDNEWFRKLRDNLTLIHHDLYQEYPKQVEEHWHLAHISDVMRLDVLKREGGIYFDMDVIALKPFDDLLHSQKDVVLGHENRDRGGLCNGIILARREAAFLKRWTASYSSFDLLEWNAHSVIFPKRWSLEFPEEVCTLSPSVFFWPSWGAGIEYMHEPLTDDQARDFERTLASHNGSIYPHQLAYHAWHHVTPQLNNLTPDIVKAQNTRFNMLVRRFVE